MADITYTFELDITSQVSFNELLLNQTYTFQALAKIAASIETTGAVFIDLREFVPEKFRESQLLQDYLDAVGLYLGTWLSKIDDMKYLVDPWNVSDELKVTIPGQTYVTDEEYISLLAGLLGLTITKNVGQDIDDFRRQLVNAIDWYKIKGSYLSLQDAIYITNQKITIKDFYTNNYVDFISEDWFVADYPGENPSGLDSTYYKSPHFGLQLLLDQVYYTAGGESYLWRGDDKFANVRGYVEEIRPANTVPHYIIRMDAPTSESGVMITTSYEVNTRRIYEPWVFSRYYFDQYYLNPTSGWTLDSGVFFDFTFSAFLASVNTWKLGTGNIDNPPDTSDWDVETPVLTGTIPASLIRLYSDRTEYEVVIPDATVQAGLTELGLYLSDGTTLVIGCTFPEIDKIAGVELRILVIMYK